MIVFQSLFIPVVITQKVIAMETIQITRNGKSHYPSWDPSGSRLFFSVGENDSNWMLRSYNLIDKIFEDQITGGTCLFPDVSYDGQKIIYENITETNELSLWCFDLSNNTLKKIMNATLGYVGVHYPPNAFTRPRWNTDGSLVFFSGYSSFQDSYVLWYASLDGSRNQITLGEWDVDVAISPDGTKIAFTSHRSGSAEIWVSNLDGSTPIQLTFSEDSKIINMHPCWSPDAKYIAFASNRNGNFDIWYMKTDGTEQNVLVSTPFSETYPSWGSNKIAYCKSSNNGFDIWISEILYDNNIVSCKVPNELVLDWNNSIEIFIENNDDYDYNYTLNVYGNGIRSDILHTCIFVGAGDSTKMFYDITPYEEGRKTLIIELYKGKNNIFRKHYMVEIKKPAMVRAEPESISRKTVKGNPIAFKIVVINDADIEAKEMQISILGDLASYATLSKYHITNCEPKEDIEIEIYADIPYAEISKDILNGELLIHGLNFENITVPIGISLLSPHIPTVGEIMLTPQFVSAIAVAILAMIGVIFGTLLNYKLLQRKSKEQTRE